MNDDELLDRITINADVLAGKPIIRGTRLPVSFILNLLAHGATADAILQEYGTVSAEDIQACLLYALKVFDEKSAYTSPETYRLEPEALNDYAVLSQAAFAVDWERPEEDSAWAHLQSVRQGSARPEVDGRE